MLPSFIFTHIQPDLMLKSWTHWISGFVICIYSSDVQF